jgi:hypothetical protein
MFFSEEKNQKTFVSSGRHNDLGLLPAQSCGKKTDPGH